MAATPPAASDLSHRLGALGRRLGAREAEHVRELESARERARALHTEVAHGLEAFHAGASESGAAHLRVDLGEPRLDDKHTRAVQFDVRRGRLLGVVTVKSRGEVVLVGPFHLGKEEGPCRTFPIRSEQEIREALAEFLESFLEEAATP